MFSRKILCLSVAAILGSPGGQVNRPPLSWVGGHVGLQWCIAKNGGGYTQTGVAKGLKVPCLFMITEVSNLYAVKKPGGWYTAYTRVYPQIHHWSRIRLWPPSFDGMLMSLFRFIYWLWTERVVVDQVLLWFRPTLILSRIPDYNVCVNVNKLSWCDHTLTR